MKAPEFTRSLRFRVFAIAMLSMMTLSALFAILFGLFYADNAKHQLTDKARSISDLLALNMVTPMDFESVLGGTTELNEDGNRILKTGESSRDLVYAIVYRVDGTVFARTGKVAPRAGGWAKESRSSRIIDEPGVIHVATAVEKDKNNIGVLFVGFSKEGYNQTIQTFIQRALIISVLLSAFFIAMFFVLITRTAVRPIVTITGLVQRIGRGDLRPFTRNIDTNTSEIAEMFAALSVAGEAFRTNVRDIAEVSKELADTSGQILSYTNELSAAVNQQATAVNETTVTIEEVERTGHLTAENARTIQSMADATQQISREGLMSADETRVQLEDIRKQVTEIVESSRRLADELAEVDRIIASVSGVTQQSQTLAINASIEAAKAGSAGRGFRVVADKIRDLSQQSREATEQVRRTLTGVQQAISLIVNTNERGLAYTERGVSSAERSREVISRLGESIRNSTNAARAIAENTLQQATGLEQTSRAMSEINVASQKNSSGIIELQRSGQRLEERARSLKKAVQRFVTE